MRKRSERGHVAVGSALVSALESPLSGSASSPTQSPHRIFPIYVDLDRNLSPRGRYSGARAGGACLRSRANRTKTLDGSEKPYCHMAFVLLIRNLVIQTQIFQSVRTTFDSDWLRVHVRPFSFRMLLSDCQGADIWNPSGGDRSALRTV